MIIRNLDVQSQVNSTDALANYRKRIMFVSSAVTIVLIAPIAALNVVEGYYLLAVGIAMMAGILFVNAVALRAQRNPPVTMGLFLAASVLVMYVSISERGSYGVFWAAPEVLFLSFALSRRLATIYSSILVTATAVFSLYFLEVGLAMRAMISLAGVVIFTNIFLSIIDVLQERLIEQSLNDPLTGALNRRPLPTILSEAIDRKRRSDIPASILALDLDHFKSLNDTYGHAVGDTVLQEFVSTVEKQHRRLDKLFRLGGEEFLLFLPDTPQRGAEILASKLLTAVAQAEFVKGRKITVSIGLSELMKGETIEEWMLRADAALYSAKADGRNRIAAAPLDR